MNNTFVTWLLGAAVAGLGLLLLLGTPAAVSSDSAGGSATLTTNGAAPAPETTSYWQDATPASAPAPVSTAPVAVTPPCSSCAITMPGAASVAVSSAALSSAMMSAPAGRMGGCGIPGAPCAETPCTAVACRASAPCGKTASCGATSPCGSTPSCAATLCDDRPRINRNGPSCADECSFVQLYSTVPLPVCKSIRFAWAATRGQFLDPASPAPIYFTPGVGFSSGEDVLITLTVTDAQGNEYSDQMKLHLNDTH